MLLPWQHHWIVKSCTISKRNSKKCFCIWRTCKWWFYLLTSIRSNMPKQIHSLVFFLLAAHNIKEKHNTGWNAALSLSFSLCLDSLVQRREWSWTSYEEWKNEKQPFISFCSLVERPNPLFTAASQCVLLTPVTTPISDVIEFTCTSLQQGERLNWKVVNDSLMAAIHFYCFN